MTEALNRGVKDGLDAVASSKAESQDIYTSTQSDLVKFAAIQANFMANSWKYFVKSGDYTRLDQMYAKMTGKDIKSVQVSLDKARSQIVQDAEKVSNLNYGIAKAATTVLFETTANANAFTLKKNAQT